MRTKNFTTQRYRYESLARVSEKTEARRRTGAYKDGLDSLSVVSLKTPAGCEAIATVVWVILPVMVHELIAQTRRHGRFA